MSPETQVILNRIDSLDRSINARIDDTNNRIDDVSASQVKLAEKVDSTSTDVTKLVAVESALSKYAGAPVRWKVISVFLLGVGALEWLMHRFVYHIP